MRMVTRKPMAMLGLAVVIYVWRERERGGGEVVW